MIGSSCSLGTNSTTSISRLRSSGSDCEVLLGEDDGAVAGIERLVDVLVLDDLAADLAAPLVTDASAVLVVHLMQLDVVVLGGAVQLDGHVDEPERDGAFPRLLS